VSDPKRKDQGTTSSSSSQGPPAVNPSVPPGHSLPEARPFPPLSLSLTNPGVQCYINSVIWGLLWAGCHLARPFEGMGALGPLLKNLRRTGGSVLLTAALHWQRILRGPGGWSSAHLLNRQQDAAEFLSHLASQLSLPICAGRWRGLVWADGVWGQVSEGGTETPVPLPPRPGMLQDAVDHRAREAGEARHSLCSPPPVLLTFQIARFADPCAGKSSAEVLFGPGLHISVPMRAGGGPP
jgi:hypothetical protein